MIRVGFFVEVDIDPVQRQTFDELILQHSRATLAGEQGCVTFDVYVDRTNPNRFALYELYVDEAAVSAHQFSSQLATFRKETDGLILKRRIWTVGAEVDVSQFPGREA